MATGQDPSGEEVLFVTDVSASPDRLLALGTGFTGAQRLEDYILTEIDEIPDTQPFTSLRSVETLTWEVNGGGEKAERFLRVFVADGNQVHAFDFDEGFIFDQTFSFPQKHPGYS